MTLTPLLFLVGLFAVVVVAAGLRRPHADLEAIDAALAQGATLLDVRSAGEFGGGHLDGALNISVQTLPNQLDRLGNDKDKPVVVYCASGMRSMRASNLLRNAGFKTVYDLGAMSNAQGLQNLR